MQKPKPLKPVLTAVVFTLFTSVVDTAGSTLKRLKALNGIAVGTYKIPRILRGALLVILVGSSLGSLYLAFATPSQASATTSSYLNFQSRLENATGSIVPDGYYNVQFNLYSASSGGSSLWTETYAYNSGSGSCTGPLGGNDCRIRVANGYLSVSLGSQSAFGSLNWNQQLYLTMNIGGTVTSGSYPAIGDGEMSPRIQLTAVPYAFQAGELGNGTNKASLDGSGNLTLQQASTISTSTGALTVQGATTLTLQSTTSSAVNLDSGTTGNVNIGTGANAKTIQLGNTTTGVATTINIGNNATASSSSTIVIGSTIGGTVQLQPAGGVILGASTVNGSLIFMNTAGSNTITLQSQAVNPTSSASIALPTSGATGSQCLQSTSGSTNTVTVLQWGSCGAGASPTLAGVYSNGTSQTDSTLLLDSTRLGVILKDNATPIAGSLFTVQNNGGTTKFLDVSATSVVLNGATGTTETVATGGVTIKTSTDSTTAFQIQNTSNVALLTASTSGLTVTVNQGNVFLVDMSAPASPGVAAGANTGGTLSGSASTTYYYKVTALNAAGETVGSSEVSINGQGFTKITDNSTSLTATASGTAGNVSCNNTAGQGCKYKVTFVTANGESLGDAGSTSLLNVTSKQVNLTGIPTSASAAVIARNIYRSKNGGAYLFDQQIANNTATTATDNVTTASGAYPSSSTATTNTNNTTITWSSVTNALSYRIYRGTSSGGESAYQAGTSPFTDTGAAGTSQNVPTRSSVAQLGIGTTTPSANLDVEGTGLFKNVTNSTSAVRVQNAAGSTLLNADTTNMRLGVNVTYAQLSAPGTLTMTVQSGGSLSGTTTYYYKVTAIDGSGGETTTSPENSATTTSSNKTIKVDWTAVTGARGYHVYRSTTSGSEKYLTTVLTNTFTDSGTITIGVLNPPSSNTAYTSTNVSNNILQLSVGGNGTPVGQLYVSGISPLQVASLTFGDDIFDQVSNGLDVEGSYAYVGTGRGMHILNISNPLAPIKVGDLYATAASPFRAVFAQGHYVYAVESFNNIFDVIDVADPTSPAIVGQLTSVNVSGETSFKGIYVSGRYAYVADSVSGNIKIIDVANPTAPKLVTSYSGIGTSSMSLTMQGRYLYAATTSSMAIIDVSNPSYPILKSITATPSAYSIMVSGSYAYVTDYWGGNFRIFNVSNPTTPTVLSTVSSLTFPIISAVQGRYAYIMQAGSSNTFTVEDVSDPYAPFAVSNTSVDGSTDQNNPNLAYVQGRYLYMTNTDINSLDVYDLGGAYVQQFETGGLLTGTLQVSNNAIISGDQNVQGGLAVGQNLQVTGDTGIAGNLNIKANNGLQGSSMATLTQAGSGNTILGFADPSQTWSLGIDSSNSHAFNISSATAAGSGSSTTFGHTSPGSSTDSNDSGSMECTQFTSTQGGVVTSMTVKSGAVDATNRAYGLAIYTDNTGAPGTLVATSATGTLSASPGLNTVSASTTLGVATYWLCANTNGTGTGWAYDASGGTNWSFASETYGTWPSSWPGTGGTFNNNAMVIYVTYTTTPSSFANSLFTIGQTGQSQFRNSTDSTTAFQIQNAAGTSLFNANTSGNIITVNQGNLVVTDLSVPTSPGVAAGANTGGTLSGAAGTTYYYKITAINAAGESLSSSEVNINGQSFTKIADNAAHLTAAASGTAGNVSCNNTAGQGCKYKVTFVTANGESLGDTGSTSLLNVTTKQINLTAIPTSASAAVTARNIYRSTNGGAYLFDQQIANNTATTATDNVAAPSGAFPGASTATTNTNNATITWTAVTGASSYRIYRGTSSGAENVYQTSATSPFTDTGAAGTSQSLPTRSTVSQLGIGTSTPSANLDVEGTALFKNASNSTTAFQIQDASASSIFSVDATTKFIGMGTTTPGIQLDLVGAANGSGAGRIRVVDTTALSSTSGGGVLVVDSNTPSAADQRIGTFGYGAINTGTNYDYAVGIAAFSSQTWGSSAAGAYLSFSTTPNSSTTRSEVLRVDQTGNLQFQAASGGVLNFASAATGTQVNIKGGDATSGTNAGGTLLLQGGAGASTGAPGSVIVKANTNNSTTAFQVQNAAGSTVVLDVDTTNGRVGIGTNAPGASLDLSSGTIQGAGLSADCSTQYSKLLWSSSTKQFSCGADRASYSVVKSADQSLTTTTLTNATDMTFNVGTSETWIFYFNAAMFDSNKASSSYKINITSPTGSTCNYSTFENNGSAVSSDAKDACNGTGLVWGGTTNAAGDGFTLTGIVTTDASHSGAVTMQFARDAGTATITQYANVSYVVAYKVSGADLAEIYYSKDPTIQPGDVVAIDSSQPAGVKKSTSEYQSTALGIVSTHPGQILGAGDGSGVPELLALSGRVPVKVSSMNGPIEPGDYLTASSIPGVAMKATRPGQMIGKAMTEYNNTDPDAVGMVIAFANLVWADPGAGMQGTDTFAELNVSGATTLTSLTVTGTAVFQGNIVVNGHVITGGSTPVAVLGAATSLSSANCTVSGNDTNGTIQLSTGDSVSSGEQCIITYTQPFGVAPRPVISAANQLGSTVNIYVVASPIGMKLYFNQVPQPNRSYLFNYWNSQ